MRVMVRKNRKKRANVRLLHVPFAGFVVAGATLALAYVWLNGQCDKLGAEISKLEAERVERNKQYANAESRWTTLKSPENLPATLAARSIQMDWPRHDQNVWMQSVPAKAQPVAVDRMKVAKAKSKRASMNE